MNNAKFALLIAEIPKKPTIRLAKTGGAEIDSWQQFLKTSKEISAQAKTIQQLHCNIWQCDLKTELIALCKIILAADTLGVPMRVLFLEESPDWLQYAEHDATWL